MNGSNALLWGFVATLLLTTLEASARGLGVTRIDLPLMLGTIFTPNRDRAKWIGFLVHLINGWIFSLLYLAIFNALGRTEWWIGALIGLGHSSFVLSVGMSILPGIHPRMASIEQGPDPTRQLEPPGFFALNYGKETPIVIVSNHILFGALLGWLLSLAP